MNIIHASRDPGHFVVDYGSRVEPLTCADETELVEWNVLNGVRRADTERDEALDGLLRDEALLPSENYFG